MRRIMQLLLVSSLLSLVACNNNPFKPAPNLPANISIGNTYYTQFALKFEKSKYSMANYRVGILLPINSKVQLVEVTNKIIRVQVEKFNHELIIVNHKKYSGGDTGIAFNQVLASNKVDLSQFTKKERQQIEKGEVAVGMRKKAVLVAMGAPPKHGTPSNEYDEWMYWISKWNKLLVRFKNGKVVKIID